MQLIGCNIKDFKSIPVKTLAPKNAVIKNGSLSAFMELTPLADNKRSSRHVESCLLRCLSVRMVL